jgi:serine/threonine-protein phosphatase 6 regulatory ankyrin repeat subunit A/serine/threonine-protein phosphatase 6 regulatory ankyrin repeat subunit B
MWAINRQHAPRNTPYLRWLLERGANANEQVDGIPILAILAGRDAVEPMLVLLEFGADPLGRHALVGSTPLTCAAARGSLNAMRLLISRGADPKSDAMALVRAAFRGQVEAIQLLLKHGADANRPTSYGFYPLHAAAMHPPAAKLLLEAGADPNVVYEDGGTPLHYAASAGNVASVKVLVQHGADRSRKNKRGLTPYQVAASMRRSWQTPAFELLALLKPVEQEENAD